MISKTVPLKDQILFCILQLVIHVLKYQKKLRLSVSKLLRFRVKQRHLQNLNDNDTIIKIAYILIQHKSQ